MVCLLDLIMCRIPIDFYKLVCVSPPPERYPPKSFKLICSPLLLFLIGLQILTIFLVFFFEKYDGGWPPVYKYTHHELFKLNPHSTAVESNLEPPKRRVITTGATGPSNSFLRKWDGAKAPAINGILQQQQQSHLSQVFGANSTQTQAISHGNNPHKAKPPT